MSNADRIRELEAEVERLKGGYRELIRMDSESPLSQTVMRIVAGMMPEEPAEDYSFAGQGDEEPSS